MTTQSSTLTFESAQARIAELEEAIRLHALALECMAHEQAATQRLRALFQPGKTDDEDKDGRQ